MRRLLTALTAVALLLCVQPTVASAAPAAGLCTPDGVRGGVPPGFVLDACVDATSITLRNDLDVPVLVRRDGDVGAPVRVHERGSATASVLRLLAGTDELLMPGDVARWPLGPAAGGLTVADFEPATLAIVDTLRAYLPRLGADDDPENFLAFAVVVRETTAAVAERTACVAGKNFLQIAACDVVAAAAVSRPVIGQLPRRPATELLPLVLDVDHWADWAAPRRTEPTPDGRTLAQAAVPVPVVVPPPVVPAAPPVVAAAPSLVAAAPPAAPPPAPAVPAPAPAPPLPDPPSHGIDLREWIEDALGRFRSQGNGNGNGHGHGHGHGNGHGGDRDDDDDRGGR